MLKKFLLTLSLMLSFASMAQDTVSVMYYNLLNFPWINSGRITHLQEIVQYSKPDLFLVNELTSGSGANTILNSALNTNGTTNYSKAAFVDGFSTDNMLYYNNEKFGLISQDEISTSLRDINEYVLYYKEPGMTASSDTVYLFMYAAHLKAGNTGSDASDRADQSTSLKLHLANLPFYENLIFGGDMNIYTSTEQAYSNIISGSGFTLVDPLGLTGNYNNNSVFANHHTQSTRTTSLDNGAGGGMDDRFDYIFHSTDISNSTNRVSVVPGSYRPLGQDGLHFNDGLLDLPSNTTVPSNVLSALYYMSDHLPITMELALDVALDDNEIHQDLSFNHYLSDEVLYLNFNEPLNGTVKLVDLTGKTVKQLDLHQTRNSSLDLNDLSTGIYAIQILTEKKVGSAKFWKSN